MITSMRLERMMDLNSHFQGAAIRGRNIREEILIANELIDSKLRAKPLGILCKVYFYKTFNFVSWGCIDYVQWALGLSCGVGLGYAYRRVSFLLPSMDPRTVLN